MSFLCLFILSKHRLCAVIWRWLTAFLIQSYDRSSIHSKWTTYSSCFALKVFCLFCANRHFLWSEDSWATLWMYSSEPQGVFLSYFLNRTHADILKSHFAESKSTDLPDSSNSWLISFQASRMRSRFFSRVSKSECGQLHCGKSTLHLHQQSPFWQTNWPSDLQPM